MVIQTIAFILVLNGAVAQAPTPPTESETVSVSLRDGSTLYGTVISDTARGIVLRLDTPWKRDERTIRRDDIVSGPDPERSGARRDRRNREWESQGYREVETPSGPLWVHKDQIALAKRARESMEATQPPPAEEIGAPETTEHTVASGPEPAAASPVRQWGAEIATAIGALVLAGLVFKLTALG